MKRTTLTLAVAGLALFILMLTPHASGTAKVHAVAPESSSANVPTAEDEAYWYFVVSYSDTDKRVTNTFWASGSSLKVYYKVRIALDGFQGDLQGSSFATREEAEQDRATKWPNATFIAIDDPLNN